MRLSYTFILILFATTFIIKEAYSWDGYNWNTGDYIEIEKGNLVREGEEIEIYNWTTGEYEHVEVDDIRNYGGSVEIDTYNWDTGEYETYEMDR